MDSQKEEAAISQEKDPLLKRLAKGGLTALGIIAATAPGIAALNEVAQKASHEHSTPVSPKADPFKQQPPPGITFPKGVRLDAPVEPVFSHKLFLPKVDQKHSDILTPTEAFFRSTKVVEAISATYNGRTYTTETRITPAATYKVTIKEELKEQVAQLVAKDGEKYQFTGAKIIIANSKDEIPEGISMGTSFTVVNFGTPQATEIKAGRFGGARMGNEVTVFFVPDADLNSLLSDPAVQDAVQRTIAQHFMRLIYSGGRGDYAAVSLAGQTDYISLINQRSFLLLVQTNK